MTRELHKKKRLPLLLLAALLCLFLLGGFLFIMQTSLAVKNQEEQTRDTVRQIQALVDNAYENAEQYRASYDEIYQSKADTAAYMAVHDSRFQYTAAFLKDLAAKMNVTNLVILDRQGGIVAAADSRNPDFTRNRYNQLRTVFETDTYEAFHVTADQVTLRYYAAKIDGSREIVVEQNAEELLQIQSDINSWERMLGNIKTGLNGYTFAVSSQDYTILYDPDETFIGQDSLNAGLKAEQLEDEYFGWMTLKGRRLLCGVKYLDKYHAYVICAVPESELTASRDITVGIVLFIFFVILTMITAYACLILRQQERGEMKKEARRVFGRLYYNRELGKRLGAVTLVGLIFLFAVAFYMQTLFTLSLRSISNSRLLEDVETTFARTEEEVELLTSQYNQRYLNKCQIAADLLSANPELQTKEELKKLSQALDLEYMLLFDKNGRETVSDSSYVNFQVSSDPEDQSYVFGRLLQGVEYVIQEPMPDELSGVYHQYIGSLMFDTQGHTDGFLQISIRPEKLEEALSAAGLDTVLNNVKATAGGFALAVEKETGAFSWYPGERMIGKDAAAYGLKPSQFRDGYSGYLKVNSQNYYGSCMETDTDYIYVVTPKDDMNGVRMPVALASTGVGAVLLLLLFALMTLSAETKPEASQDTAAGHQRMISVRTPDDREKKTESAASRWAGSSIQWDEKTPEQQLMSLLKALMAVFAAGICLAVLFKEQFLGDDSIFLYIISGSWERGVNVFAITGSIMIICVISVFVMIFREILRMLSRNLDARGETVCRMLRSFAKYLSFIAMLYYCLALLGVDTKTLLASAGILSLVIGLGAKTLVSDILAGLFIIFEGEFRVGDIVTIGDWRGTVQEIGVRTTKIMDAGQNVKIISNSDVSGVINMTKKNSYAMCDVGIEYGESLERVESILAKELPNIRKRLPAIKEGPFYKGVVSLGDNSVNVRIMAQCAEGDRAQLGRDLNREMKLLFDNYDINIPFPQVVLNQPKEYIKATATEKKRADLFNESQKELSKELTEEEQDRTF